MEFLNKKQKVILIIILGIMVFIISYYIMNKTSKYNYSEIEEMEEEIENLTNTNTEETNLKISKEKEEERIILHMTGAVVNEGIIELENGARILDAIEACGGTTEDADLSEVNLAYKVEDEQKIYIPNINDKQDVNTQYITKDNEKNIIVEKDEERIKEKVNINTASQTELETLSGIGPSTALKIINYRRENGDFKEIENIKNVSGIGDAKFEVIKEQICVD